jgi:hypothetical protein
MRQKILTGTKSHPARETPLIAAQRKTAPKHHYRSMTGIVEGHFEVGDEQNMQTPNDTRTAEAKRLDELALQYRTSRDPKILTEMRTLARHLAGATQ